MQLAHLFSTASALTATVSPLTVPRNRLIEEHPSANKQLTSKKALFSSSDLPIYLTWVILAGPYCEQSSPSFLQAKSRSSNRSIGIVFMPVKRAEREKVTAVERKAVEQKAKSKKLL